MRSALPPARRPAKTPPFPCRLSPSARAAELRPERHVPNSVATVRKHLTIALAKSLYRCPCCQAVSPSRSSHGIFARICDTVEVGSYRISSPPTPGAFAHAVWPQAQPVTISDDDSRQTRPVGIASRPSWASRRRFPHSFQGRGALYRRRSAVRPRLCRLVGGGRRQGVGGRQEVRLFGVVGEIGVSGGGGGESRCSPMAGCCLTLPVNSWVCLGEGYRPGG